MTVASSRLADPSTGVEVMMLQFDPDARGLARRIAFGSPKLGAVSERNKGRTARRSCADPAQAIALDIDQYGSPVALKAANWLVCFVPGLRRQWWHRLVHRRHKHVFAMRPEQNGTWTLFEPWWRRLMTASLTAEQARKFLAWAAAGDVLLVRESIPGSGSQIFGWANCAVLVSFLLGRGYRTWTPHGFYRRLKREQEVRPIDVPMLLALETSELAMASQMIAAGGQHDHRILQSSPQLGSTDAGHLHGALRYAAEASSGVTNAGNRSYSQFASEHHRFDIQQASDSQCAQYGKSLRVSLKKGAAARLKFSL